MIASTPPKVHSVARCGSRIGGGSRDSDALWVGQGPGGGVLLEAHLRPFLIYGSPVFSSSVALRWSPALILPVVALVAA
jgi:hypothetical protein